MAVNIAFRLAEGAKIPHQTGCSDKSGLIMIRYLGLAIPLLVIAIPAHADPLPAQTELLLRTAADKSDAVLGSTADVAKKAFPKSAKEIDALVKQLRSVATQRHQEKLRHLGLLRGWKGHGQVGASNTSGNTRSTGLAVGLDFSREGLKWSHTFNGTFDYERDNGVETKGRYFGSYQSNYRFSDQLYLLGLASWESDRFSGFGYTLVRTPAISLSVEGGPALRQTDYVVAGPKNTFAARAAVNYAWSVMSNLKLTENMSYYNEDRDGTFTANTALTVGLIGSLSMQASYLAHMKAPRPHCCTATTARRARHWSILFDGYSGCADSGARK
jgi:putative salt-induced outer membrane protein